MEKEEVIEKLEEVFEVACDRFVKSKGNADSLSDIRELGDLLIISKRSILAEAKKASEYIDDKVEAVVRKNDILRQRIIEERREGL